MIKVGQIYKTDTTETMFVVTYICDDFVSFITNIGYANERYKTSMEKDITTKFIKLIAEYPTWQEAVNSKEFKDGIHSNS